MLEEIDDAMRRLADTKAGWVTRRDSADLLGRAALKALGALQQFSDEMDVDVKRAVDEALGRAAGVLKGVTPITTPTPYSLEELVRACEKAGSRTVEKDEDGYVIRVRTDDNRAQAVHVRSFKRSDGIDLIQVYTVCGKSDANAYEWALRANMKLIQGAIALAKQGNEERFVLTACFLASEITKAEIKAAVKEVARYGDWIESKLSGMDEF